jgi:hypothetical protein
LPYASWTRAFVTAVSSDCVPGVSVCASTGAANARVSSPTPYGRQADQMLAERAGDTESIAELGERVREGRRQEHRGL